MKSIAVALSLLLVGATTAAAHDPRYGDGSSYWRSQYRGPSWERERYYEGPRYRSGCQEAVAHLRWYERRTLDDGHVTKDEHRIARGLRYNVDRKCGGYR